jgi:hypothetical protein
MRLFIDQLEAMAKLKGKVGQQKVTVEHVHVHERRTGDCGDSEYRKDRPGGGAK